MTKCVEKMRNKTFYPALAPHLEPPAWQLETLARVLAHVWAVESNDAPGLKMFSKQSIASCLDLEHASPLRAEQLAYAIVDCDYMGLTRESLHASVGFVFSIDIDYARIPGFHTRYDVASYWVVVRPMATQKGLSWDVHMLRSAPMLQ